MARVERIPGRLDIPDPDLDALWAKEAEDRLAAYRRGEIRATPLAHVLTKYAIKAADTRLRRK